MKEPTHLDNQAMNDMTAVYTMLAEHLKGIEGMFPSAVIGGALMMAAASAASASLDSDEHVIDEFRRTLASFRQLRDHHSGRAEGDNTPAQ